MLLFALAKGLLMGVAIAAPVGPIGILCIRRTLAQGRLIGLCSGLGAASADGLYGLVAAFGLSALSNLLVNNAPYLQLIGGCFLCYLGLTMAFSSSRSSSRSEATLSHVSLENAGPTALPLLPAYTSTLALTLTNPATILSFIAIFAGFGFTQSNYLNSVVLVLGVFSGSMLWWTLLVSGVAYLRNRLTAERLSRFNQKSTKVFGAIIFGFGVVALVSLLR
ncbi:MAG: LysE family transporter [Cyanobacteria bacterium P01_A01_bin.116]